jgi:hypothetical protein
LRKLLAVAALLAAATLPAPAVAGETGAIKGVVIDSTCYGPCMYPPPPPRRYVGDDLVVRVRRLPDYELVARVRPKDGRFRVELAPGLYRLRPVVLDGGYCWHGQARRVHVVAGQTALVRLEVYNDCIR